jgi:hypothetical protein
MISGHADVKRMLLEMTARSEMLRALALRTASFLDLADISEGIDAENNLRLGELLLPLAKTINAENAFDIASQGIQVLGGYGYTNDYPLERMTRDIRVASIYEGTSGIQALDFLKRKVLADEGATLTLLIKRIRNDADKAHADNPLREAIGESLHIFEETLNGLLATSEQDRKTVEPGAYHFLQLSGLVVMHWLGMHLYAAATDNTEYHKRMQAALTLSATGLAEEAQLLAKLANQKGTQINL